MTPSALNDLMDKTAELPFVGKPVFDLNDYVTDRALDGLFRSIARQEELIREDPVARTTELLRKWFGTTSAAENTSSYSEGAYPGSGLSGLMTVVDAVELPWSSQASNARPASA